MFEIRNSSKTREENARELSPAPSGEGATQVEKSLAGARLSGLSGDSMWQRPKDPSTRLCLAQDDEVGERRNLRTFLDLSTSLRSARDDGATVFARDDEGGAVETTEWAEIETTNEGNPLSENDKCCRTDRAHFPLEICTAPSFARTGNARPKLMLLGVIIFAMIGVIALAYVALGSITPIRILSAVCSLVIFTNLFTSAIPDLRREFRAAREEREW